jgi:hypothetical protein
MFGTLCLAVIAARPCFARCLAVEEDSVSMLGTSFVQKSLRGGVFAADNHWHDYHDSDALLELISQLGKSGSCAVNLSVELKADKVDPTKNLFIARLGSPQSQKRVFVVANEHARERITGEVALRFIEKACDPLNTEWRKVFSQVSMTIVPIVNLLGRKQVETSDPCLRYTVATEGSVDLNRNMDVDFVANIEGHGPKPFSTYQARILRDIAAEESPLAFVDLHSGAKSLMVSWGARWGVTPDYPDQSRLLEQVKAGYCTDCEIGSNRVVIAYMNEGETIDHMYAKQGVKYSTLWEVYEGASSECEQLFNPPARELHGVATNWANALHEFAHLIAVNVSHDERSTE